MHCACACSVRVAHVPACACVSQFAPRIPSIRGRSVLWTTLHSSFLHQEHPRGSGRQPANSSLASLHHRRVGGSHTPYTHGIISSGKLVQNTRGGSRNLPHHAWLQIKDASTTYPVRGMTFDEHTL